MVRKLMIKESTNKDVVKQLNDINNSDTDNNSKISKITNILNTIETGYVLDIAVSKTSSTMHLEKVGYNKWSDEGIYTYNTYDIADEIVNGSHKVVRDLWNKNTAKTVVKYNHRNAPYMWRK